MNTEIILPRISEDDTSPEDIPVISFKEFLKTNDAEIGTIIRGVKPRELYTYQKWLNDTKVANVLSYIENQSPALDQITGYLRYHPVFDENVLVIGNGTHRALYALVSGRTVDIRLDKERTEHTDNPWRVFNLVRKYGNPFINL